MGGFVGTHKGVGDVSSTGGLPGRREGTRENSKCDEREVKGVIRKISLAGRFFVNRNICNLI